MDNKEIKILCYIVDAIAESQKSRDKCTINAHLRYYEETIYNHL